MTLGEYFGLFIVAPFIIALWVLVVAICYVVWRELTNDYKR